MQFFVRFFVLCLIGVNSLSLGVFAQNADIFPDLPLGVIDGQNGLCRDQSRLYVDALRNLSLWAYESKYYTQKLDVAFLNFILKTFLI